MDNIDYDRLREDLKEYALGAYFGGGIDAIMGTVIAIESASEEELLIYLNQFGLDLENYIDYGNSKN